MAKRAGTARARQTRGHDLPAAQPWGGRAQEGLVTSGTAGLSVCSCPLPKYSALCSFLLSLRDTSCARRPLSASGQLAVSPPLRGPTPGSILGSVLGYPSQPLVSRNLCSYLLGELVSPWPGSQLSQALHTCLAEAVLEPPAGQQDFFSEGARTHFRTPLTFSKSKHVQMPAQPL